MSEQSEPMMALKITGTTLNKIMRQGYSILEMQLKDLWNAYVVKNIPVPATKTKEARTVAWCIVPEASFHRRFEFVEPVKKPQRDFLEIRRIEGDNTKPLYAGAKVPNENGWSVL